MDLTYEQAIKRLEEISQNITSGQLDVDDLAAKLKEANQLVEFCTSKLKKVEDEVNHILKETEPTSQP